MPKIEFDPQPILIWCETERRGLEAYKAEFLQPLVRRRSAEIQVIETAARHPSPEMIKALVCLWKTAIQTNSDELADVEVRAVNPGAMPIPNIGGHE